MNISPIRTILAVLASTVLASLSLQAACFDLNSLGDGSLGDDKNTPNHAPELLYKSDGASEVFSTVFSDGGLTATVSWGADVVVDFTKIYLKAGPGFIFWDVSKVDWSEYDCFSVTNLTLKNPGKQIAGISHIQVDGTYNKVPDAASTVALLALGLVSLGLVTRRRTA